MIYIARYSRPISIFGLLIDWEGWVNIFDIDSNTDDNKEDMSTEECVRKIKDNLPEIIRLTKNNNFKYQVMEKNNDIEFTCKHLTDVLYELIQQYKDVI